MLKDLLHLIQDVIKLIVAKATELVNKVSPKLRREAEQDERFESMRRHPAGKKLKSEKELIDDDE